MKALHYVEKIFYYANTWFKWNKKDVILASSPKSGNTWVRYFLLNYFHLLLDKNITVTPIMLEEKMPSFGADNFLKEWNYDLFPRFVKTHWKYVSCFAKPKKILIIRDPRDVMVSYFYYINAKKNHPNFDVFSDFLRNKKFGLEKWFKYHRSWLTKADLIIKYEDLKKDDIPFLKVS